MTAAAARILTDSEKRNVVIGVLVAMFLATLDQTIVAPALPTIGAALGDVDFLPWIVSAYLLTSTAVTPLYGKLSDIHGRRPVLIGGLLIFLVGSVMCALAPSMTLLIAGRAVQGLGGGGLITLAQTVIADIASPRERAKYVVYISTVWATSSVAGPVLGGFLAQHLSWTLIFWINLPLCAIAILVCGRILRDLPQQRRPHRLDILGSVADDRRERRADADADAGRPPISLDFAAHPRARRRVLALLAAWLGVHLTRAPEPLIPLSIFANDVVGKASGALFFSMFAFVGATVYLPIYFEYQLGLDPTARRRRPDRSVRGQRHRRQYRGPLHAACRPLQAHGLCGAAARDCFA